MPILLARIEKRITEVIIHNMNILAIVFVHQGKQKKDVADRSHWSSCVIKSGIIDAEIYQGNLYCYSFVRGRRLLCPA
jgi:hypothetical protein